MKFKDIIKTKEEFDARIGVAVCLILIGLIACIHTHKIKSIKDSLKNHVHLGEDIFIYPEKKTEIGEDNIDLKIDENGVVVYKNK